LGNHEWDEPLKLITENNRKENLNIMTPMIGEKVNLDDHHQVFSQWWKGGELRILGKNHSIFTGKSKSFLGK
jgi:hypothetical protein